MHTVHHTNSNSLTQQYLSYHRQTENGASSGKSQNGSVQDLCRKQLQENLARESFNMQSLNHRDENNSPVDYRVRNGSPLRR